MRFILSGFEAYISSVLGLISFLTNKEIDLSKRSFAEKLKKTSYEP